LVVSGGDGGGAAAFFFFAIVMRRRERRRGTGGCGFECGFVGMIFAVGNKAATGSIAAAAGGGTAVVATLRFFRGRMFIRQVMDEDASLGALRFFWLLLLLEAGDDDDDDRSSMTSSTDPCRLLVGEFPFAVLRSTAAGMKDFFIVVAVK
jgi:hypothetical protein